MKTKKKIRKLKARIADLERRNEDLAEALVHQMMRGDTIPIPVPSHPIFPFTTTPPGPIEVTYSTPSLTLGLGTSASGTITELAVPGYAPQPLTES